MRRIKYPMFALAALISIFCMREGRAQEKPRKPLVSSVKPIEAKDFSGLIGMPGFSDTLLENHFRLYQGYVKNTNALLERLIALLAEKKDRTAEYAELKRRLGWEFNGVLLHEYYFANLGGDGIIDAKSALYKKIAGDFGGFDKWEQDFISTAMMRGIGWVVLYEEPRSGKLVNAWINEHDSGHIAGSHLLLVIDVFEHAFMPDYQLDREKYIESFFKNINWKAVQDRSGKLTKK